MNNRVKATALRLNIVNWYRHQGIGNINKNSSWLSNIKIYQYFSSLFSGYQLREKSNYLKKINLFKILKFKKKHFNLNKKKYSSRIKFHYYYKLQNLLQKKYRLSSIINKNIKNNLKVYIGSCSIKQELDGLYIYLNYYFDFLVYDNPKYADSFIKEIFKRAINYLKRIFNQNVYLIKNNIYAPLGIGSILANKRNRNLFKKSKKINPILNFFKKRLTNKNPLSTILKTESKLYTINATKLNKKHFYFFWLNKTYCYNNKSLMAYFNLYTNKLKNALKESKKKWFDSIKLNRLLFYKYTRFTRKLFFLKKNEHFNKLHKILFCAFSLKTIDIKLIVNVIALELNTLRKGHKYFFNLLDQMLSYFFKLKKPKKIKGIYLVIKGRLILKNRQTPRKKKFILNLGKNGYSTFTNTLIEENAVSISRFGKINVKLSINYFSAKTLTYYPQAFINSNFTICISDKPLILNFMCKKKIFKLNALLYKHLNNRLYVQKISNQNLTLKKVLLLKKKKRYRSLKKKRRYLKK